MDGGVETCNARVGPVTADHVKDVSENVRFGDGAVNVGNNDFGGIVPEVDVGMAKG